MARLTSPGDAWIEIKPLRYEFEHLRGDRGDFDYDANWVVVSFSAHVLGEDWKRESPAFLTLELQELVRWARGVANDVHGTSPEFLAIEPCLHFEARREVDQVVLRAYLELEFRPPSLQSGVVDEEYWIDLSPARAELLRFSDELEREISSFPPRPVGTNAN